MKKHILFLTFLCFYLCSVAQGFKQNYSNGYPITDKTKVRINSDWKFFLGNPDADYYNESTNDSQWEQVSVPHTLKLTSISLDNCKDDKTQPTFQRNVGWYRKSIFIADNNKRKYLEFEGAHQITTLWINGKRVGIHKTGGYTPFFFDITDYVIAGKNNQITLLVDNRRSEVTPPDPGPFDYIKFSGLYRDVYYVEKNSIHITNNIESMNSGVTITTPSVDYINGNATIDIRTEVRNESKQVKNATLIQRVVDANGNVVLKLENSALIKSGESYRFYQIGGIDDDVHFWDINNPYLYKVNSLLLVDGKAVDVVDNRLGIRKFELDPNSGFRLNGKNIELIGFNRHQHYAYIGDALPNSLHYRDMIQFKKWGFNCVRTAHYPQDDELIKACDELGILVYEEPPTWISISQKPEWYENEMQAARVMVRNHKNSPSVVIWGAGINHRGAVAQTQFTIKQEDPTRLTASQSSRWSGWQTSNWADIFANMNYGPGIWSRQEPLLAMEGHYGPDVVAEYKRDPMMPGIISWTAHAYYTFHDIGCSDDRTRLGAMDVFRYPKDERLFWYPSEMLLEPYIHVCDDWSKNLNSMTIYSNADYLELVANGKTLGRFNPSSNIKYKGLSHPPYEISGIDFQDGNLLVKAFIDGKLVKEEKVFTPGKPVALKMVVDTLGINLKADDNDIVVVHAEVIDAHGMRIKDYDGEIKFTVKGDATVVGDKEKINNNPVPVKMGVGSALIRAGKKAGNIQIIASSKGLKSVSANLQSVPSQTDCMIEDSYPIYDSEITKVDMGAPDQLLQFGWTPWNGTANNETLSIGDTQYSIHPSSETGMLRWLGEMNVIGKNGFVYGEGVLGIDKDGIVLEIKNLTPGIYHLKSYHHAPSSNTNDMDPNLEKLKNESIHKLPFAKKLEVSLIGTSIKDSNVKVTSGKELQYSSPAVSNITFTVKENESVKIRYKSLDNNVGVWLNGFELKKEL